MSSKTSTSNIPQFPLDLYDVVSQLKTDRPKCLIAYTQYGQLSFRLIGNSVPRTLAFIQQNQTVLCAQCACPLDMIAKDVIFIPVLTWNTVNGHTLTIDASFVFCTAECAEAMKSIKLTQDASNMIFMMALSSIRKKPDFQLNLDQQNTEHDREEYDNNSCDDSTNM